jgi:putative copper resistance protein D
VNSTERRLNELAHVAPALQSANVEMIAIPHFLDAQNVAARWPALFVSEGIREITETYKLFARSFSDERLVSASRHVEFLIDKQGYIRARWLPAENAAWRDNAALLRQVDSLNAEKPRAPAPEDLVH